MPGKRLLVVVVSLGLMLLAAGTGVAEGWFVDQESSAGNTFDAWTSTAWVQTTQADFEAGVPSQADTRSSPGDVKLATADRIYAFQGGSAAFWRYDVPFNSWTPVANAPAAVGAGGVLTYDGARYIYAFRGGGNNRTFWRYSIAGNSWTAMTNAPANVGTGGALAYDGVRYIYAFRGGGNNRTFWRYSIAGNSWTAMTNAPAYVGTGGALAYDGVRYIYAFRGNSQTAFWRYDINGNTWATMAVAPATVAAGGALAYDSSGYVYGSRGNGTTAFWRYNIAGNSWTPMTNTPTVVLAGGALAKGRLSQIYAFKGGGPDFWRYDTGGNSWTAMANALGNVADGGALAFVAVNTYVGSATMASQVRDTGVAGARWDALFWDETLQLSTDITFEVRASDTLFAKDAATPAWTPVGGTSPVTSGLPSGRYMQWWATLTTSDAAVTPLLHEVRLYHY
jgi:hypothetical protein